MCRTDEVLRGDEVPRVARELHSEGLLHTDEVLLDMEETVDIVPVAARCNPHTRAYPSTYRSHSAHVPPSYKHAHQQLVSGHD